MSIDELRKQTATSVVKESEVDQIEPDLPPAGFQREDELARRTDQLAEAVDAQAAAGPTMGNINPAALDHTKNRDNEILSHYEVDPFTGTDVIAIEGLDHDHFEYKLVNWVNPLNSPGRAIYKAKAQGWEFCPRTMASGTMKNPEGKNLDRHSKYDTPYIGDTLLMRMGRERFERIAQLQRDFLQRKRARRDLQTNLVTTRGVIAHTDIENDPDLRRMLGHPTAVRMAPVPTAARAVHHAAAQSMAEQQLTDEIRTGTVPGMRPIK